MLASKMYPRLQRWHDPYGRNHLLWVFLNFKLAPLEQIHAWCHMPGQ